MMLFHSRSGGLMDFVIVGAISAVLFVYLIYCLVYPDKF
ncbi:MAG: potassium-transporting ATPase subunit F [Rhizobacter sp.]|nr:potassium-transporting ATPase subunit F [Bacteriovorax sp.]